jgi:hypothetical protein
MSQSKLKDNNNDTDIEILELFIDKNYSEISDIHYEMKNECNQLYNGLFYHSNDFDFINLLRNHIVAHDTTETHSDSEDENYEITDI